MIHEDDPIWKARLNAELVHIRNPKTNLSKNISLVGWTKSKKRKLWDFYTKSNFEIMVIA